MNLKRFKRGGDKNSDELLKWIEEGCFDALSKKYLKSAVLTILADTNSPNNVLETYTLRVNYPDSILHQTIDATTSNIAQLSLTRNDQSILAVESSPSNFKESISKILRSLCVMSQTLKSLPARKCLSMKLSYYEEVTPMGYEPPGFVAAEFDIDHLFQRATSKYSFGKAGTPFHNIGLSMETVCDDSVRPSPKTTTTTTTSTSNSNFINSQALVFPDSATSCKPQSPTEYQNTIDVQEGINFNESIMIASQVAQASNSPVKFPPSQAPVTIVPPSDDPPKKASANNFNDLSETQKCIQIIKCTCGHNFKDLEMLQCDRCMNWQHSVCAGFVSCRDRRLENSLYICYFCKYGKQVQTFNFLQKLSQFRKALAVISADGFENISRLGTRLGVSKFMAKSIRDRLVNEKFLIFNGKTDYSIAKKDEYIKERIKFYFNQNLEIHPEFIKAQEKDNSGLNKRKHVEADCAGTNKTEILAPGCADSNISSSKSVKSPVPIKNQNIPIEINTIPFQVQDTYSKSTKTPSKPDDYVADSTAIKTPPDTVAKKKRKISIPSSRISCYLNNETAK